MTEPCRQEGTIKEIKDDIRGLLIEIRDDQKRQGHLLETLARQDERLKAHAGVLERHERDIDGLYGRVRKIESAPGQSASRAWWLVFGALCSAAGAVIARLIAYGVKHG